jgi:hypothetical protein
MMDERPEERPVERETVIVDRGSRGGGGGIIAILAVLVIAILAFLFFGGWLQKAADNADINVNIAPKIELPDIRIDNPPAQQQQQPEQQPANASGK